MGTLLHDIRISLRTLLKQPTFLIAAVLVLAFGIGAITAIFSFVNSYLLHPLRFPEADRVVQIWEVDKEEEGSKSEVAPGNFLDWRQQSTVFEALAGYLPSNFNLTSRGEPERVAGALVSASFFQALGVKPLHGRGFLPGEDAAGATGVAVVSHELWQRRFGGDPGAVGQSAIVGGKAYTLVGVLPPEFHLPHLGKAQVWVPLSLDAEDAQNRTSHWLYVLGRLKPGATLQQAQAEMDTITQRLAEQHPRTNARIGATAVPLVTEVTQFYRPSLLILMVAAGCLLLLAAANVANLQLARTNAREREIAIRMSLGAGRLRLLRQMFVESLVVSLLGAGLGLLIAYWAIDLMVSRLPAEVRGYVPNYGAVPIDGTVLLFSVAVAFGTAALFGLAPALRFSRPEMSSSLKEGGRTSSGLRGRRARAFLVVSEVALALVLLVTAALLIRSFSLLQYVDPGFKAAGVVTTQLDLPEAVYPGPAQTAAFYDEILRRIATVPGVVSAAVIDHVPMGGSNVSGSLTLEGVNAPADDPPSGMIRTVSADYFRTLGIPVRRGRGFTAQDRADSQPVVLINQALADFYWPKGDAVGKRIKRGGLEDDNPWMEIVGVVGDIRHWGLDDPIRGLVYLPVSQQPQRAMTLTIRTAGDPASVTGAVRREVLAADPNQPLAAFRTLEQLVDDSLLMRRTGVILLGFFGVIALVVGAVGIFGILSYSTAQRTHEVGVRMALGASRDSVLKLVLRQSMKLTGIGLAIGLVLSFALGQAISGLLYGIGPADLTAYATVVGLLLAVALIASYIPARRATKVPPVTAMRYE